MPVEHLDVLVVGAGLSGIGAAYHLQKRCPDIRFLILESRDQIGGTWDLFRYPGIRSDSDMFTLGYSFRPWTGSKSIADGAAILEYVRATAREFGIDRQIRFQQRVVNAAWSSEKACWMVEVEHGPARQKLHYSCNFLYICSGYYRYSQGYTPDFPGLSAFKGHVIHPQHWPADLDYSGQSMIVIGSGATAVTLVPALARQAAHVTMLQRSPSYMVSMLDRDHMAKRLRRALPAAVAYRLVRLKNLITSMAFHALCRARPEFAGNMLRKGISRQLPADFPVDTHFQPHYAPWDQRLCLVKNGDLFRAIRNNRVSMVTDQIDCFTEQGLRTASGQELQADIIVTATGLELVPCGGIQFEVDGKPVELGKTYSYKGLMLSGVPNMAICVGYTSASWTLRADLVSRFVCRLLNYMERKGFKQCVPKLDSAKPKPQPLLDLNSGYILRSAESFPKQGERWPWRQNQNYLRDLVAMRFGSVKGSALAFRGD